MSMTWPWRCSREEGLRLWALLQISLSLDSFPLVLYTFQSCIICFHSSSQLVKDQKALEKLLDGVLLLLSILPITIIVQTSRKFHLFPCRRMKQELNALKECVILILQKARKRSVWKCLLREFDVRSFILFELLHSVKYAEG